MQAEDRLKSDCALDVHPRPGVVRQILRAYHFSAPLSAVWADIPRVLTPSRSTVVVSTMLTEVGRTSLIDVIPLASTTETRQPSSSPCRLHHDS